MTVPMLKRQIIAAAGRRMTFCAMLAITAARSAGAASAAEPQLATPAHPATKADRQSSAAGQLSKEQRARLAVAAEQVQQALALHNQGKTTEAIEPARRREETRKAILEPKSPEYLEGMSFLCNLYRENGNDAKADPLLRKAIQTNREDYGSKHPCGHVSLRRFKGPCNFFCVKRAGYVTC